MAQSKKPIRSRNWCFTDFELLDFKKVYDTYNDIIRYLCFGLELCPKTKKQHYQGWIQFVNPKRLNGVKKILGSKKIHVESCRGSELQNNKYCCKDGKHTQLGSFKSQGCRTDLENIKRQIENGTKLVDIISDNFEKFCQYRNGIKEYKQLCDFKNRNNFRVLNVTFICGPTGVGKTRFVFDKETDIFKIQGSGLEWFDGYDGEDVLLIDEYNNNIKIDQLLALLDGYKLRLPLKGSFTYANWHKVYITSNLRREELHPNAKPEHINALDRRVNNFIDLYKSPGALHFDTFKSGTKWSKG